jgi:hypothetical protein
MRIGEQQDAITPETNDFRNDGILAIVGFDADDRTHVAARKSGFDQGTHDFGDLPVKGPGNGLKAGLQMASVEAPEIPEVLH